ncbi:MAG TPA: CBS domain-containing protein [Candidatus Binatia bacterium]
MSTDLVTLKLTDTLRLADDIMNLARVRHFPVLDGDKLVGVVNQVDLLYASMASLRRRPKNSLREALGAIAVKDVMKQVTTVTKDTTIRDAARTMVERDIECLLVTESDQLLGLVSRTDLLRELANTGQNGD